MFFAYKKRQRKYHVKSNTTIHVETITYYFTIYTIWYTYQIYHQKTRLVNVIFLQAYNLFLRAYMDFYKLIHVTYSLSLVISILPMQA